MRSIYFKALIVQIGGICNRYTVAIFMMLITVIYVAISNKTMRHIDAESFGLFGLVVQCGGSRVGIIKLRNITQGIVVFGAK